MEFHAFDATCLIVCYLTGIDLVRFLLNGLLS